MRVTIRMSNGDDQVIEDMPGADVMSLVEEFDDGSAAVLAFSLGDAGEMAYLLRQHVVSIYVEPEPDQTA